MNNFEEEFYSLLSDLKEAVEKTRKKTVMVNNGRFNSSRFNAVFGIKGVRLQMFIRLAFNYSMMVPNEVFLDVWMKVGKRICDFGDEYGDMYNDSKKRSVTPRREAGHAKA